MKDASVEQAAEIAKQNDEFRQTAQQYTVTQDVAAIFDVTTMIELVREYDKFTEDNDPYGEHDFGSFFSHDIKLFWKIDYFDQALQYWCDPLSESCRRVLTIMLAEEY